MATYRNDRRTGVSLAKGPVVILGIAALAFGILGLALGGNSFDSNPTEGPVFGDKLLGIEGNGWTNLAWITAGAVLLVAAHVHLLARLTALLLGLALGAGAIIALADGDVLGVFATNAATVIVLGAAAVVLVLAALLPRFGRRRAAAAEDVEVARTRAGEGHDGGVRPGPETGEAPAPTGRGRFRRRKAEPLPADQPAAERDLAATDRPAAERDLAATDAESR